MCRGLNYFSPKNRKRHINDLLNATTNYLNLFVSCVLQI